MSRATEKWTDTNRFNQTGYSSLTLFPQIENYENKASYWEDYMKAKIRQRNHEEFMEEMRNEPSNERELYEGEQDED